MTTTHPAVTHCGATKIYIQPLTNLNYIETVQKFLFKAIKKDFGFDYIPEYHQDILKIESFYLYPERNTFLIASLADVEQLIGSLGIFAYDRNFPEFKNRYNPLHTASFGRVIVDENFRRMGIGTALVKIGENFCRQRGYSTIYLHTQRNVPGALQFWLKNGFKVTLDTHNSLGTVHMEKLLLSSN